MEKGADAFRTISEVAEELDLPQHVLRFWETRFRQIKPMKRGGGRRYYRPDDIELLRGIKALLYDEGYTIRGVQRLLKEHGNRIAIEFGRSGQLDLESGTAPINPDQQAPQSRPAVTVTDIAEAGTEKKKSGSFLGRLASRATTGPANPPERPAFGKEDVEVLRSTLQELLECKRLLDQTRQS